MDDLASSQKSEERELYSLSEPIPLTNLMVERSVPMCIINFAILIALSALVYFMDWMIPINPHERDYLVWGDKYVNDYDKSRLVAQEL